MLNGQEMGDLAAEEGRNFLRTHAVMAWILYDWHAGGKGGRRLNGIAFDKLGSSTLRVWENLADQELASFHFPYSLRYGLHGMGPAVESIEDGRVCYLGEIITHVDGLHLGANQWFAVDRSRTYDISLFGPGITPLMMDEWHEGKKCPLDNKNDRSLVQTWAQAISTMDHHEIRALGTHCSVEDTLEDIIAFELVCWGSGVRKALQLGLGKAPTELRKALRYANEIVRKSEKNSVHYAAAWQKVNNALQSGSTGHTALLLSAFQATQQPADAIWGDPRVVACRQPGKHLSALTRYAAELARWLVNAGTPGAVPAAVSAAHEAYVGSHLSGLPQLGSPGEVAANDSGWASASATLTTITHSVVGSFPSL